MKKEADLHAEEDKKKRDVIEAKNIADNLYYTCEKTLKDAGEKVPAEMKKDVEEKMEALKKVKDGDNIDDIKQKTQDLSAAIQKVGAEMYKQNPPQQPGQNPSGENPQGPSPNQGPEEGKYKEK